METTGLKHIDIEKDRSLLLTLKGGRISFASIDEDMGEMEALLFLQLATATLYEAIQEKQNSLNLIEGNTTLH